MKKLGLVLFLACTTFLTSCSSDDDSSIVIDPTLAIGEWNLTSFNSEGGALEYTFPGLPTSSTSITATGSDYDMTVTFSEDPKTIASDGSFTLSTAFEIAGVSAPSDETIEGFFDADSWSIEGSTLTITEDGDSTTFRITNLTESTMNLETDLDSLDAFGYFDLFELAGLSVTTSGVIKITLTK